MELHRELENHQFEIVDFAMKKNSMVDLSSSLCKKLPEGNPQWNYRTGPII